MSDEEKVSAQQLLTDELIEAIWAYLDKQTEGQGDCPDIVNMAKSDVRDAVENALEAWSP